MKKIPTLFVRNFDEHHNKTITREVTPGLEWVLAGEGTATLKVDGSCCAIIDGIFYKRYDAKAGKTPPAGAIPCCDPDPITGHWPHWVEVDADNPADKWLWEAFENTGIRMYRNAIIPDGTYESVGPHFQGNPYRLKHDMLIPHGKKVLDVPRTFDGLNDFLHQSPIEGIVFWKDGQPQCKIKRSDFGYRWPCPEYYETTSFMDL